MSAINLQPSSGAPLRPMTGGGTAVRVASGAIVCDACGCRLTTRESIDDAHFAGARTYWHYAGAAGRDARGCTVACADLAHRLG